MVTRVVRFLRPLVACVILAAPSSACTRDIHSPDDVSEPAAVEATPSTADAARRPAVHVVYLVPADREPSQAYRSATARGAGHLRLWLRDVLPARSSFRESVPPVTVLRLPHETAWYRTNPRHEDVSLWFWFNVLEDAFALSGGSFGDRSAAWLFFIDADPGCGQLTGGAASVALLPANDLRGLSGEPTRNVCTGDVEPEQGVCRWVGGLGHELGHALGMPHPPGCEEGAAGCATGSLMWLGYLTYPAAHLTAQEQSALIENPVISRLATNRPLPACSAFPGPRVRSIGWMGPEMSAHEAERRVECSHQPIADAVQPFLGQGN